jgi:hypothetical protein
VFEVNSALKFSLHFLALEKITNGHDFGISISCFNYDLLATRLKEHVNHLSSVSIKINIVSLIHHIVNDK